jgi:Na+-driven multidrug efflux pump
MLFGGIIRGYGYSLLTMIFSLTGMVAIRQIWLAISLHISHEVSHIYWGYPIGWISTLVPMLVFYFAVILRKYGKADVGEDK